MTRPRDLPIAPCEECGYRYELLDRAQILRALASLADEHRLILTSSPGERLRDHTRPGSWSLLEYGCHVRDVLRFQRERIALAQAEDVPRFGLMHRDERVSEEGYNGQDPSVVADEIVAAAHRLIDTLESLDEMGWLRTGIYPRPTAAVRTVEWIGRWTAHELAHHLFDQRRLLDSA